MLSQCRLLRPTRNQLQATQLLLFCFRHFNIVFIAFEARAPLSLTLLAIQYGVTLTYFVSAIFFTRTEMKQLICMHLLEVFGYIQPKIPRKYKQLTVTGEEMEESKIPLEDKELHTTVARAISLILSAFYGLFSDRRFLFLSFRIQRLLHNFS
jgi:hypothetical protein